MGALGDRNWAEMALRFFEHPLFLLIVIALAVRFALAPLLTYDYDIYHWGVVIQNFQSGNGLYDLDGYYYTPTWGYILGFFSLIQDALLNVDVFGVRIVDLLDVESMTFRFHTATTTTPEFNLAMKFPLIIIDIIVALVLYKLIKDRTGNERKSTVGAALWLFCPTVVYMSGIQAQFDTISALMMLLTIILVYKDRCFLAGMLFGASVLLKFFPGFTIIVLVAYILVKHREDGTGKKRLMEAILGAAIMCLVLFIPQIMDGTIMDSLSFITGRLDIQSESGVLVEYGSLAMIVVALLGMVYFGYLMYKTKPEEADSKLFVYALMALIFSMLMTVTPQYMMVLMPLLILHMVSGESRMWTCWILISLGSFISAFLNNNFMLLDSASAFYGLVSPEWIISVSHLFETPLIGGFSLMSILTTLGGAIEYIGLFLVIGIFFEGFLNRKVPKIGGAISKIRRWDVE